MNFISPTFRLSTSTPLSNITLIFLGVLCFNHRSYDCRWPLVNIK